MSDIYIITVPSAPCKLGRIASDIQQYLPYIYTPCRLGTPAAIQPSHSITVHYPPAAAGGKVGLEVLKNHSGGATSQGCASSW